MTDRTFTLSVDSLNLPLVVTQTALDDFLIQGLGAMDECLSRLSAQATPANDLKGAHHAANAQDLVGQMMLDGVVAGNTRKLILCALWLAHYVPDAIGLTSNSGDFRYVYDGVDDSARAAKIYA